MMPGLRSRRFAWRSEKDAHRMALKEITANDRMLAGAELTAYILFWLLMFVPCTIWFVLATAFGAFKRSTAKRSV